MSFLFSCESVGIGHPDKLCDLISDSILDHILKQDKNARIAIETMACNLTIIIAGEVTTNLIVDYESIVRHTIEKCGYTKQNGTKFNDEDVEIINRINSQNTEIGAVVDQGAAGDQGSVFGYATDETQELMPLGLVLSHKLVSFLKKIREIGDVEWLLPDCKAQVTVEYEYQNVDLVPLKIHSVVLSVQHKPDVNIKEIRETLERVVNQVIDKKLLHDTVLYLQPSGHFVLGGPEADCGLTGRKIIVDTYGGWGHHGGGAFSGKDPSKMDRSGAYMARYIAKSLVSNKLAKRVSVQLSYCIGVAEPVSINIDTFGTGTISYDEMIKIIRKNFKLTPTGIKEELGLYDVCYSNYSVFGHFGRKDATWENSKKLDK